MLLHLSFVLSALSQLYSSFDSHYLQALLELQFQTNKMKRTVHKVQLPNDFAQRLLDNQIQLKLAQTPAKQVICNLIELYTYGVQYYESIRSYKYLYFQKKMNELFTSGSAIQAINKKEDQNQNQQAISPVKKKMNSAVEQQKIQALKIKQKQQKMLNQILQKTNYSVTGYQAKQILNNTDQKIISVQKVINDQLQSQNKSLQQKLRQRKAKTLIAKSLSSIQLFQTQTRDSLFDSDKKKSLGKGIKQPLIVDFGSLINQNDESDQQDEQNFQHKRKLSMIGKRVMSTQNLHDINDQL